MNRNLNQEFEPLFLGATPLTRAFKKISAAVVQVKAQTAPRPPTMAARTMTMPTIKFDNGKVSVNVPGLKQPAAATAKKAFPIVPVAIAGAALVGIIIFKKSKKK